MVYSDLLFFLGLLPVSILMSFFDKSTEYKNLILVLTSLVFFSWGKPFAVCLIFLTAVAEWALGLWIEKLSNNGKKGFLPLIVDIAMNSAVFVIMIKKFSYINNDVFGFAQIIIPISIGFYVIKGFVYIYDVFKGTLKAEKNVFCLLTFMCAYFFLPSGPVAHYGEIEPQIRKRSFTAKGLSDGLTAFVCGLSKAVILCPALKSVGNAGLYAEKLSVLGCWIGIIAMSGFLYFLFTGFCDISYGIGKMYGFEFEKNYKDLTAKGIYGGVLKNVNCSLADFFEDVTKNKMLKWLCMAVLAVIAAFRSSRSLLILAVIIAVSLAIILEKTVLKSFFEKAPVILRTIVTVLFSMIVPGGLMFDNITDCISWLKGLVGVGTNSIMSGDVKTALLNNIFIIIISVLLVCTPLKNKVKTNVNEYSMRSIEKYGKVSVVKTSFTSVLFILCIIIIASANITL